MDPGGVIRAAEFLYGHQQRKQAAETRAAELESGRQHDLALVEARGGVEGELIGMRGEEQRATQREGVELETDLVLPARQRMEESLIGSRGVQARETDAAAFELRAPLEEARLGLQERGQDITREGQWQRHNLGIMEEIGRNDRFREPTGEAFPLQSFGRDIADDFLYDPETGDLDPSRIPALMDVMAGQRGGASGLGLTAGAAAGGRTTTPPAAGAGTRPGLQQNEAGVPTGYISPQGDFQLDSAQVAGIRGQSIESHIETLLSIPDGETRMEYLEILEPMVAETVLGLFQQRGR